MLQKSESVAFKRLEAVALVCIVVLGAFLRCRGILYEPYGIDELQSISFLSEPSYEQFLAKMKPFGAPPMPGYFRLEYFLYQHVYSDVLTIRLLSVAAGILALPFMYLLARRLAGGQTAILATLCITLSPFCVHYSQEARMYALLPLYAIISVHAMVLALDANRSRLWWAVHLAANVLLTWTHMFSALVCVAEGLFLLRFHFRRWGLLFAWGGFHFLLFLWLLGWIKFFNGVNTALFVVSGCAYTVPIAVIPIMSLLFMAGGLAARTDPHLDAYIPALPDIALNIVVYGLTVWFVVRAFRQRRQTDAGPSRHVALLALWLVVPVVVLTVMAYVMPCFWSRYLIASSPALALLAAMAAMAPVSRLRRRLACAALIGVYGIEAALFLEVPHRADIPGVDKYLRAHRHKDEILVTYKLWEPAYPLFFPGMTDEGVVNVEQGELAAKMTPIISQNARTWLLECCWSGPSPEIEQFVKEQDPCPLVKEFPSYFSPIRLYLFEGPAFRSSARSAASPS